MILPGETEAGSAGMQPPNKRLKLTGDDRLNGSGVLFARAHSLSFSTGCADG